MFSNIKLAIKLPALVVVFLLTVSLSLTLFSKFSAESALDEAANRNLEAINQSRISELSIYLASIEQDLELVAKNPFTADAITAFIGGWNAMGSDPTSEIQRLYMTPQMEKLTNAGDGSEYTQAHVTYHNWFRNLQQTRGYYDVFLFDLKGNLVYSVFKEPDFATNVQTGQWRDSDLGNIFRSTLSARGGQEFVDFAPYQPSKGAPASFISQAVMDANGNMIGVLSFQMPIDKINSIMQQSVGMGESGETYLVGHDGLMRSDSRFSETSTILKTKINTESAKAALDGKTGILTVEDYRGIEVLSAFGSINFKGVIWAMMGEIDLSEVQEPSDGLVSQLIWMAVILTALLTVGAYFVSMTVSSPLTKIVSVMAELAKGKLELSVPYVDRGDDVGDIAKAIDVFKVNAQENLRLSEEARAAEAEKASADEERMRSEAEMAERKRNDEREAEGKRQAITSSLTTLIEDFDTNANQALGNLTDASSELASTSVALQETSEQTGIQSASVAAAAEEATANVQTVASAAEELGASILEISRQIQHSTEASNEAAGQAKQTAEVMVDLEQASQAISEVVNLINDIAEQTNLLALNATIESARAGEAGKGFAVVAGEVKSLASQTAKATEQISTQIQSVQQKSHEAATAMGSIQDAVEKTAELALAVASAVEEQQAATNEIARNVQDAAQGTQDVSQHITSVAAGTNQTKSAADTVYNSSQMLSGNSEKISDMIKSFLGGVDDIFSKDGAH